MTKRLRRIGKWWRVYWSVAIDSADEVRACRNLRRAEHALLARDRVLARKQEALMPDRPYPDPSSLVAICLRRSGRSKERGP